MTDQYFKALLDKISRARDQFPKYRSALTWLISDLFQSFPWPTIKITTFSMIGAALRGVALGGAVKYLHILEENSSFDVAGVHLMPREIRMLVLGTFFLFLIMCLSSWLLFLTKIILARLMKDYQKRILIQTLDLFGGLIPPSVVPPKGVAEALRIISGTVAKDAQELAKGTRFLGGTLSSVVVLMYGFPIIFYIDPVLTLILIGLACLFLPLFYQSNILAYRSILMTRRSGPGSNLALIGLMDKLKHFRHISHQHSEEIKNSFNDGDLNEKLASYPFFLRSKALSDFWSNILLGLSVTTVLVAKVPSALSGDADWVSIVSYLVFLKLTVGAFKNVMTFFTKFSRLYPCVYRFQQYLASAQLQMDGQSPLLIKVADNGISEKGTEIAIVKFVRMALITRLPLSRYTFPYMVRFGTKSESGILISPQACHFIGSEGLPQRDGSVRSMLRLPGDLTLTDLAQFMHSELFEKIMFISGEDFDESLTETEWLQLSLTQRVELGIIAGIFSPARVIVVSCESLDKIPEIRRERALWQLRSRKALTVITYPLEVLNKEGLRLEFDEDLCAVSGNKGDLLALGSLQWVVQKREEILKLIEKERSSIQQESVEHAVPEENFEEFDDSL